jgi:hypothetical protein
MGIYAFRMIAWSHSCIVKRSICMCSKASSLATRVRGGMLAGMSRRLPFFPVWFSPDIREALTGPTCFSWPTASHRDDDTANYDDFAIYPRNSSVEIYPRERDNEG